MIKLRDVHAALERELTARWPEVCVYHDVTPKDFERPSFYVELTAFEILPLDGSTAAQQRTARFKIVALELIDEYHNSQVEALCDKLDALTGLFARGYLAVGDRAPHLLLEKGELVSTDAAAVTFRLEWAEDLDELAGDPRPDAPALEHVGLGVGV